MDTTDIYAKAQAMLKELSAWSVLDSILVLETAKQQLLADTIVATQAKKKVKK